MFVPFAAFWLLVNVAPWGYGGAYLYSFYLAFTLQKSNVIFPFTYAFAVATFVTLLWAGSRWTRLSWPRVFLIASTVPFAGPGAFEILYQEAGVYARPFFFVGGAAPYVMFSFATWVVLGLTGVAWWRLTLRWWAVFVYSVGGFLVWIAIGYPLVKTGSFDQLPAAYFLNISLKGSFYLVFLVPVLEGMHFLRTPRRNGWGDATDPSSAEDAAPRGVGESSPAGPPTSPMPVPERD